MKLRRKPAPLILIGAAALAVVVVGLYISYRVGLEPVASAGAARSFTVLSGEDAQGVATRLKAADLIRGRNAFITYINIHGLRTSLKAGEYHIAPTQSGEQIAELIADGETLSKNLVIPEGYRLSQIETAVQALGISQTSFETALAGPHTQTFLASKPANIGLEGYLFPDSYQVAPTTTAADLVNAMLDDFGQKVGTPYVQAFATEGLTLNQGLTIASIVEGEVSNPSDRPIVAQIFLKRLKLGMPLGSDVTAEYASKMLGVPFSTAVNSPYNTLLAPGLPPGPIDSPGLNSLDAVAHPANTDYLYFLTGKDGKTYYATTYAQHQLNIAKYLD